MYYCNFVVLFDKVYEENLEYLNNIVSKVNHIIDNDPEFTQIKQSIEKSEYDIRPVIVRYLKTLFVREFNITNVLNLYDFLIINHTIQNPLDYIPYIIISMFK